MICLLICGARCKPIRPLWQPGTISRRSHATNGFAGSSPQRSRRRGESVSSGVAQAWAVGSAGLVAGLGVLIAECWLDGASVRFPAHRGHRCKGMPGQIGCAGSWSYCLPSPPPVGLLPCPYHRQTGWFCRGGLPPRCSTNARDLPPSAVKGSGSLLRATWRAWKHCCRRCSPWAALILRGHGNPHLSQATGIGLISLTWRMTTRVLKLRTRSSAANRRRASSS